MHTAFMIDDPDTIVPIWETTSCLMYEANQRGHEVYIFQPHDIYIKDNVIVARMRNVTTKKDLSIKKYWRSVITLSKREELVFEKISEMDVVFLRKNPPLDHQVMEFLVPLEKSLLMLNSPQGQLKASNKLYMMNFPELTPVTHVSRDPKRLNKVIQDFGGTMVIKPINRFRGEGVIKVSAADRDNLNSLIHFYVRSHAQYAEREPIMVQEYIPEAKTQGDVRVLLLGGEIIGAMRRKSLNGGFRANINTGGKAFAHELTDVELGICESIKENLLEDGLHFVGIDILGGKLLEINCVSPGGLPRINSLYGTNLEANVLDYSEKMAFRR